MVEAKLFGSNPVPTGTLVTVDGEKKRIWHVTSVFDSKRNKYYNTYWFQRERRALTEKGWQ